MILTEEKKPAPGLYLRQSSGLTREVGLLRSSFFGTNPIGTFPGWGIAFVGIFAFPIVAGIPLYSWYYFAMLPGFILYAFITASLSSAIPRTGGAYLYSNRILHPYLGWIESWCMVGFWWSTIAYEAYSVGLGISFISYMLDFLYPGNGFANWGTFFTTQTGIMVGGIICLAITTLLVFLSSKRFYFAISILGLSSALIIPLILLVVPYFSNPATFTANFQSYTGQAISDVLNKASQNGWMLAMPTLAGAASIIFWQFWVPLGFNWNSYIAGELKGNVFKNSFVGSMIALAVLTLSFGFLELPYISVFGHSFLNAWSYLYWNGYGPPLGIPPFIPFVAQLAVPSLSWLFIIIGVGILFSMIFTNAVYVWIISRTFFAWSFDRMAPEALSRINPRTRSPLVAIAISMVGAFLFLVYSVYVINLGGLIYFGTLLTMFMWILPGFSALLIARRRPGMFARMSINQKVGGVALITILGAVWLCYVLPIFGLSLFYPILSSLTNANIGALAFLGSSGILFFLMVVIAGTAVYFLIRRWNRRRGIDLDMIFSTIPPD